MRHPRGGNSTKLTGAAAGVVACSIFACVLGGCTPEGKIPVAQTDSQLLMTIQRSTRPVLVDFYKDNCPTCVVQEAELEQLMDEYAGQVQFVRFKIREATMAETSQRIMDKYKLFWVPTTILFVRGQEKQRWVFNHAAAEFRGPLTALVGRPAQTPVASARPKTPSWTLPSSSGSSLWSPSWGGASGSSSSGAQCTGEGCQLRPEPGTVPPKKIGTIPPKRTEWTP